MTQARSVLCVALILSLAFLPLGMCIAACFGYQFDLTSYPLGAGLSLLLALGTMILSCTGKEPEKRRKTGVLLALAAPLALINAHITWQKVNGARGIVVMLLLCVICCLFLSGAYGKPKALKVGGIVLAVLLLVPFAYFAFTSFWTGGFAESTVVRTLSSPGGQYNAELIENPDAVNRRTCVEVLENKRVSAVLFTAEKRHIILYSGSRDPQDLLMSWKDDDCLVIDGKEYPIE